MASTATAPPAKSARARRPAMPMRSLREQRTLTSAPGTAAGTTIRLCLWCPAHAALETGSMDDRVEYISGVAHERAGVIREGVSGDG
jgi:hypothetical protein